MIEDIKNYFRRRELNKNRISNMKEHGAICSFINTHMYSKIEENIEEEKDKDRIHHLISELALEFMNSQRDGYGKVITDWEEYRRMAYVEDEFDENVLAYIRNYMFRLKTFGI